MQQLITEEKEIFEKDVDVDAEFTFNLPYTLKKIDRYNMSKFMKGDYDTDGFKRLFFNISRTPLKTSQKAVDIDTKDIKVKAEEGASYYPAWFADIELRQFMKDEGFAEFLNQITERYPKYGEVVVKDVAGVPENIYLKNLRWEPSTHIEKSPFIHQLYQISLNDFERLSKDNKDWTNTDTIIAQTSKQEDKTVYLVERTGYFKEDKIVEGGDPQKYVYGSKIATDPDQENNKVGYFDLDSRELKKNPYRSLSWEEVDGIGLGLGVMQELFGDQEFYNDVNNKERKALEWNSKKVFKGKDDDVHKNLFRDFDNGDVIDTDITELVIAERNLGQYNALYGRIEANANQIAFTHEINTGQAMKSGTPFRLGALQAQAVDSYFEFKREKLGLFLKGIINDFILPAFKKSKRKAHILNLEENSEELAKFDTMIINQLMQEQVNKFEKKHGQLPSVQEYEDQRAELTNKLLGKGSRFLNVPGALYDRMKATIEIIITGEKENTGVEMASLTNLYSVLVANGDPRASDVLDQAMNVAGINPVSLGVPQEAPATPVATATATAAVAPQLLPGITTGV